LYQIIKAVAYTNYCTMQSLNLIKVCVVRLPNVLTTTKAYIYCIFFTTLTPADKLTAGRLQPKAIYRNYKNYNLNRIIQFTIANTIV